MLPNSTTGIILKLLPKLKDFHYNKNYEVINSHFDRQINSPLVLTDKQCSQSNQRCPLLNSRIIN